MRIQLEVCPVLCEFQSARNFFFRINFRTLSRSDRSCRDTCQHLSKKKKTTSKTFANEKGRNCFTAVLCFTKCADSRWIFVRSGFLFFFGSFWKLKSCRIVTHQSTKETDVCTWKKKFNKVRGGDLKHHLVSWTRSVPKVGQQKRLRPEATKQTNCTVLPMTRQPVERTWTGFKKENLAA